MTTEQLAAAQLIQRAFQMQTPSIAELLINSAKRIDPTLDAEQLKAQWIQQWVEFTHQTRTPAE